MGQKSTGVTVVLVDDDEDHLRLWEVDLVITDLHMPAGDGVRLAEDVRRRGDVSTIVVTGSTRSIAESSPTSRRRSGRSR